MKFQKICYHNRLVSNSACTFDMLNETLVDCVQMVWARTEVVGCGVRRCAEIEGEWREDDDDDDDDDENDNNENILFLVCNYGPGYESLLHLLLV